MTNLRSEEDPFTSALRAMFCLCVLIVNVDTASLLAISRLEHPSKIKHIIFFSWRVNFSNSERFECGFDMVNLGLKFLKIVIIWTYSSNSFPFGEGEGKGKGEGLF